MFSDQALDLSQGLVEALLDVPGGAAPFVELDRFPQIALLFEDIDPQLEAVALEDGLDSVPIPQELCRVYACSQTLLRLENEKTLEKNIS